jgi:two-component system NtrC family response regulator
MATILVIHNQLTGDVLTEMLEELRHKVIETDAVADALHHFADGNVDIVFINQQNSTHLPTESLNAFKSTDRVFQTPVIVVTTAAKSDDVIETMRLGAFDHLSKPISPQELNSVINRALTRPKQDVNSAAPQAVADGFLVGLSPVMRRVEKLIGIAASCEATVLVSGETGTGKNTVARTIHKHSRHNQEPLTIIDCTAVPEDYESFQSLAPGAQGTVILDEIGDLNTQTQAMLVRALKETFGESATQARIIATTQYDLIAMVNEKRFREDLYYRLNVLPIVLPPLRERGSDILVLSETFLQQASPDSPKHLNSAAAKLLLDHKWSGNVRELENLMYHLTFAVRSPVIEAADLTMIAQQHAVQQEHEQETMDYYEAMAAVEKRLLERALAAANGSRAEAARLLGINRQLLYAKLKTHGLMGG